MKEIKLTKGYVALVDDADYEWLNQWKWFSATRRGMVYANRNDKRNAGKQRTIAMHRLILGITGVDDLGDHIDGNGLNNQRANLRKCTRQENTLNRRKIKYGISMYKGVRVNKKGKIHAVITFDKKRIFLGNFKTEPEAAKAYNNAAKIYHGEFAQLNSL